YIFANDNFEFPVREGVKASEIVASWGKPRFDALTLDDIARRMDQARAIIEKSGFDAGPDR
ncbi:MAG: iron ABC transporter substrate-binding protein, partial [Hyphomicrobiales bacterium]|nr:iron ABC transporter substrate-binding protein [Hyphomicrobiales bacterium]